jgi:hypothetical protein
VGGGRAAGCWRHCGQSPQTQHAADPLTCFSTRLDLRPALITQARNTVSNETRSAAQRPALFQPARCNSTTAVEPSELA